MVVLEGIHVAQQNSLSHMNTILPCTRRDSARVTGSLSPGLRSISGCLSVADGAKKMDIDWMRSRAVSNELQRLHDRLSYTKLCEV
jgi:hypothetical protein